MLVACIGAGLSLLAFAMVRGWGQRRIQGDRERLPRTEEP